MKSALRNRLTWLVNMYNLLLASYLLIRFVDISFVGISNEGWLGLLHTFALWLFIPLLFIVPWVATLQAKRTGIVACTLLMLGVSQLAPLPGFQHSAAPHDIRVLTYNLRSDNPTITDSINWIHQQAADVLVLQEVTAQHHRALHSLADRYPYTAVTPNNIYLLSRFPIVEQAPVILEERTGKNNDWVALRAVIDIDDTHIAIYGVHLTSPLTHRQVIGYCPADTVLKYLTYNEARRNAQITTLLELATNEDIPVILAGDFNLSHTSPIINTFHDAGWQDTYRLVGRDWGMTWSHASLKLPILRIDYVWSNALLTPLRMVRGSFNGSDHLPLVVDLQITPQETTLSDKP